MEIRLYFQLLKRGWWVILLTALAALASSLGASYLAIPQYKSVARFILKPSNSIESSASVLQSFYTLERVVVTYAEVMNSDRVFNDTLAFLNLRADDLKDYTYESEVLSGSSILELSVTGPNPQTAAKVANTIGYQTINFTQNMNQIYTVDFLDIAVPSTKPISPQPLLYASLATVLGLFVGGFLAILREQLRIPLDALRNRFHFDTMTGVYTSRYFSSLVEEELAQSPEDLHSIGIVELQGLQDLPQTLPLSGLQHVFQRVTDTLRRELRGNDIIGRWNENDFMVMLPNTSGLSANRTFERIFKALSEPIELDLLNMTVGLDPHLGGAEYSNNISMRELLDKTNGALEKARRNTVSPVYVWQMENPFWEGLDEPIQE